jgi:hypothetical protein
MMTLDKKEVAYQKKKHPAVQMISGAIAGFVESSICHPLDTIKTRMQIRKQQSAIDMARARSSLHEPDVMRALSSLAEPRIILTQEAARARQSLDGTNQLSRNRLHEPASLTNRVPSTLGKVLPSFDPTMKTRSPLVAATLGPFGTAKRIIEREGFLSLYKGLTAVYFGIIPKMSLRFFAFEQYRDVLLHFADNKSTSSNQYVSSINFFAGLLSGLTEAVVIVTPAEVCKIRMQAQYNSLVDPAQVARRKYTNVIQTAAVLVREEGVGALYKGVVATMLRQGCNQAVNFSTYNWFKKLVLERESTGPGGAKELKHWQSLLLGGISGGFGPVINNPLGVCL